ncbi:MAG: enoyl-CoA hydratase-related protein, partial [Chloroflexota bacterium]|nr:enoyl-CoA hydratase-related protein [Chloroflexota bacterium]
MDYKTIIWELDKKGVATITLNRPERLNALTVEMSEELWDAFERTKKSPEVRVVVVTGAGRGFCSGADVKDRLLTAAQDQKEKGEPIEPQFNVNGPLLMRSVPKPIIASLNGPAVGFGLTFALGCDIRIASEKATLGAVFVRVGLPPEFGGTYNLARLAGVAKACELVFSGQIIDA